MEPQPHKNFLQGLFGTVGSGFIYAFHHAHDIAGQVGFVCGVLAGIGSLVSVGFDLRKKWRHRKD